MITFEEIVKANDTIITTGIEKKDKKSGKVTVKEYAEVNQRIKAFRMLVPDGSIETELVSLVDGMCVFRAVAKDETGKILGTGTAYEKEGSSFINSTSYIENCETSAVGRALAMCGIGIDLSIASYEEVANAKLNQKGEEEVKTPLLKDDEVEVVKPNKKLPKEKSVKNAYPNMPSREKMIEVCLNHFPDGSKNQELLLRGNNAKSVDDFTDVQLLAIYNKFSGK